MPFDWITFILLQNIGKPRTKKGESQYKAIKTKERIEQNRRNEINRAKVAAFLRSKQ